MGRPINAKKHRRLDLRRVARKMCVRRIVRPYSAQKRGRA